MKKDKQSTFNDKYRSVRMHRENYKQVKILAAQHDVGISYVLDALWHSRDEERMLKWIDSLKASAKLSSMTPK